MNDTKRMLLENHGPTMSLSEVADLCNMKESTLKHRLSSPTNDLYRDLKACMLPTGMGSMSTEKVCDVLFPPKLKVTADA